MATKQGTQLFYAAAAPHLAAVHFANQANQVMKFISNEVYC